MKGITLLATGDFTHPLWLRELEESLEEAEEGLYRLRPKDSRARGSDGVSQPSVPRSCRREIRFILCCEVSNVYRRFEKTRRVHNLVFMPNFAAVKRFNQSLSRFARLESDGRPIMGMDCEDLLSLVLDTSQQAFLTPAHVWTPHFSLFGSGSGFDSIEECYGDLSKHIHSMETGLSSDPSMYGRLSFLDGITLISNSDAHSPENLGREANVFSTALDYPSIKRAIESSSGLEATIELFPQEGKYHFDGHRNCDLRLTPQESKELGYRCPKCERKLTLGVLHRIEALSDRDAEEIPPSRVEFESLLPLDEILSELLSVGSKSKRVSRAHRFLISEFAGELPLLREHSIADIGDIAGVALAESIRRLRKGEVKIVGGYDGRYGRVELFSEEEREQYITRSNTRKLFPRGS